MIKRSKASSMVRIAPSTKKSLRRIGFSGVILCGFFLFFIIQGCASSPETCGEPVAEQGYEYDVFASGLPSVDNITKTDDGMLYVTLERSRGRGQVVHLLPDGRLGEVILKGLQRPDGLRAGDGKLFIVEESKNGRLLEYDIKSKELRTLARIGHLEGLIIRSKSELIVTKDRKNGKLLSVNLEGKKHVLARGLKRPEGIVMGGDGEIYIAETSTGKILVYKNGEIKTLLSGLNKPDQLALTGDGAILITEDADPGRFLSFKNSKLTTLARCLDSPQGILPLNGAILVSEQGRGRVLRFRRR